MGNKEGRGPGAARHVYGQGGVHGVHRSRASSPDHDENGGGSGLVGVDHPLPLRKRILDDRRDPGTRETHCLRRHVVDGRCGRGRDAFP